MAVRVIEGNCTVCGEPFTAFQHMGSGRTRCDRHYNGRDTDRHVERTCTLCGKQFRMLQTGMGRTRTRCDDCYEDRRKDKASRPRRKPGPKPKPKPYKLKIAIWKPPPEVPPGRVKVAPFLEWLDEWLTVTGRTAKGLSYEVARIAGISPDAASRRLSRWRKEGGHASFDDVDAFAVAMGMPDQMAVLYPLDD